MKQFLIFITTVFVIVFFAYTKKKEDYGSKNLSEDKTLKVFSYSSFVSSWGPGPKLKELFEKSCSCKLDLSDGADSSILLQRLQSEPGTADVVIGFDQFDIEKAESITKWKKINLSNIKFVPEVNEIVGETNLVPFDWGVLAFVGKKNDSRLNLSSFESLLNSELKNQFSMQDPRTSSPGLQFLFWLIQVKGEEEAFQFLKKFLSQAYSFASGWSTSYGLFQKGQVRSTFSYTTSPLYHQIEEKDNQYIAYSFSEGHPTQFEFMGVPESCGQCDLAQQFVQFMLSAEAQKILMEKNYMFPVVEGVKEGTPFNEITGFKVIKVNVPTLAEKERILKRWAELRRSDLK